LLWSVEFLIETIVWRWLLGELWEWPVADLSRGWCSGTSWVSLHNDAVVTIWVLWSCGLSKLWMRHALDHCSSWLFT